MVEKVMMVLEVEWLMMMLEVEWWSKHSPSLGSSHMGGKQTREWRSWNPESLFTNFFFFFTASGLVVGKGEGMAKKRKSWELRPSWLAVDLQLAPRACVSESQSRGRPLTKIHSHKRWGAARRLQLFPLVFPRRGPRGGQRSC